MAVFNQDDLINSMTQEDQQDEFLPSMAPEQESTEGGLMQFTGGLIRTNTIASAFYLGKSDKENRDPAYTKDFYGRIKNTEFEPLFEYGGQYVENEEEEAAWKERIRSEMELARTSANGGWMNTLGMLTGGILDPTLAIPAIGAVSKVKTLANVANMAKVSAGMSAAGMTASEAVLHQSQALRTKEESMYAIAGAAVIGGVLGGGIGGIYAGKTALSESIVKEILKTGELPKIKINSVGAAEYQLSDASIAKMPDWVIKSMQIPGLRAPILEGLTAKSPLLKDISTRLFENNLIKTRNLSKGANVAESVALETKLKIDMHDAVNYRKSMEGVYSEYLGYADRPTFMAGERMALSSAGQKKMSFREFNEEVGKATRRLEPSTNPFIRKAVEEGRKQLDIQNKKMEALADKSVINIIKQRKELDRQIAQLSESDVKMRAELNKQKAELVLPRTPNVFEELLGNFELRGRESYFTIMADKNRMIENRLKIEDDVTEWLVGNQGMDRAEARGVISEYVDKLMGLDGDTALSGLAKKHLSIDTGIKFTKERTTDIPDTLLEPGLVNDGLQNISKYIQNSNTLIRFQEFLNDMGVNSVAELKSLLANERATMKAKVPKDANYNNLIREITEGGAKDDALLDDFIAMSLNQYSKRNGADRMLRWLRDYNYVRLMGYVALSSITDVGMPILKYGLGNTLYHGYGAYVKNAVTGARKLVNEDLAAIHAGLDIEVNNTLRSIWDPDFTSTYMSRPVNMATSTLGRLGDKAKNLVYGAEQGTKYLAEKYGRLNFMDYWNLFHRRLAGNVAKAQIIRLVKNYDTISAYDKTYLNSIGIGKDNIAGLNQQLNKHAYDYKGAFITNTEEWSDPLIREIFEGAMIKEIDSTLVIPGRGDISRIGQKTELAKVMLQFKSFFAAATTKVTASGIQRMAMGDLRVAQGVLAMIALGALQYNLRMVAAGKEADNDPKNLIMEAISRGPLLGLIGDATFGLAAKWAGLSPYSRFGQQSVLEYPWGPSASLIKDFWKVSQDAVVPGQEWDDKSNKAALHLAPYQNWFVLRQIFDKLNKLDNGDK